MIDIEFDFTTNVEPTTIEPPVEVRVAPDLRDCIRFLAGHDLDGARVENGVGFSKQDTDAGRDRASWSKERWDQLEWPYNWAYRMVKKYHRQFEEAGWPIELIKEPKQPDKKEPIREIDVNQDGWFTVHFAHLGGLEYQVVSNDIWDVRGRVRDTLTVEGRQFKISPDGDSAKTLRAFAERRPEFNVSERAHELFYTLIDRQIRLVKMSRAIEPDAGVVYTDPRLWPHQQAGIEYVREATAERVAAMGHAGHGVMIADQMGTGKTGTGYFSALEAGAFNPDGEKQGVLVICPASVKYNHRREAIHWLGKCDCKQPADWPTPALWHLEEPHLPDLKVRVLTGTGVQPIDGDVVIVNYDILRWSKSDPGEINDLFWMLLLRDWHTVIVDECHYLKNEKALRTEAVKHLFSEQQIPLQIMMSGSPILNRTDEFVPQLELIGLLKNFGNRHNFERNYCGSRGDRRELNIKLREIPGYLARLKRDHVMSPQGRLIPLDRVPLTDLPAEWRKKAFRDEARAHLEAKGYEWIAGAMSNLPDKRRTIELLELDNRREYDYAMSEFRSWLREQLADVDGGMEKFIKMMRAEVLIRIEKLRQLCVRGKMKAAISWIEDVLDTDEKLIVFVTHTDVSEVPLMKALAKYNPLLVTGGQDARKRDEIVQTFQNDPTRKLLIGKLQSAGEGINLTAACEMAMLELMWNPGKQDQGEDRIDRGGQTRETNIHYLFAASTIDQTISTLIDSKRSEVTAATHGGDAEENAMIGQMLEAVLNA